MGLFDDIKCEYPLPDWPQEILGDQEKIWFQTKDLSKSLGRYKIDSSGQLYFFKVTGDYVKIDEPEPKDKKLFFPYKFVKESEEWILNNYNGSITFYTSFKDDLFDLCGWIEYSALSCNGKISGIILSKLTMPRNWSDEEKLEINNRRKENEKRQSKTENDLDFIKAAPVSDGVKKLADNIYYYVSNLIGEDFIIAHEEEDDEILFENKEGAGIIVYDLSKDPELTCKLKQYDDKS